MQNARGCPTRVGATLPRGSKGDLPAVRSMSFSKRCFSDSEEVFRRFYDGQAQETSLTTSLGWVNVPARPLYVAPGLLKGKKLL